jgi:hypothetical protein
MEMVTARGVSTRPTDIAPVVALVGSPVSTTGRETGE